MSHHPTSTGLVPRRDQPFRALKPLALCWLAAASTLATTARGQGLLDIGPSFVEEMDVPFTGSINSSIGWDSDPGAGPSTSGTSGSGRRPDDSRGESIVWQNSINLDYDVKMRGRNRLRFHAGYTNLFYFEPPAGGDDMDHNGEFVIDYSRQISRSLTVSNALFLSYETEPNYDIGVSVNQGNTGYFLGSNRLSGTYRWNRRFSTVSGYTISSILYEDDTLDQESYIRHVLSQQFRYAFRRRLVGTLTYRFGLTNYDEAPEDESGDYSSHTVMAGVDYQWNRRLSMSVSAGGEYRTYDAEGADSEVAPRVEAVLNYIVAKRTTARWVNSFSLDDTGRAGSQSGGYSYRTGLSLQHVLTRRLNANLSLNYVHQDFGDSLDLDTEAASSFDASTEDTFYANVGFNYRLWKTWSLTGSYSYTVVDSDDPFSEYDRSRIFVGVSYSF